MSKTIFVVVPKPALEDETPRTCAIHRNDNPHGGEMLLRVGDAPLEVMNSSDIRRRIRSGDLVEVKPVEPKRTVETKDRK